MNRTVTNSLLTEMDEALEQIAQTAENMLQRAEQSYTYIQESIYKLNDHIIAHAFRDTEEEIYFFKEIKPLFLKELIFYSELFYIETNKPVGSIEVTKEYYGLYLHRVRMFFERNELLYQYYRTGKTHYDEVYYRRNAGTDLMQPHFMPEMDSRFSTLHSYKLGKIMAFEQLRDYLQNGILRLGNPDMPAETTIKKKKRNWTDTKAALIELAYALHARGSVNNGRGDIKELIRDLEMFFNVQLGNFYRTAQSMRIRKKNRSLYLDVLKISLEKYMDERDIGAD